MAAFGCPVPLALLRAAGGRVPVSQGCGLVCELTAAMEMKCWERMKELTAIPDRLSSLPEG